MGTLYIISTPIGNLEDITFRALRTLFEVSSIACEDTRVTGNLLELLKKKYKTLVKPDTKPTLISYRNENEQSVIPEIIAQLQTEQSVALVSDAGTPLISDPGFRLVQEAMKRAIPIQVIPGVSAFVTALTGSGLPTHAIYFLGFLPEKPNHRVEMLKRIKISDQSLPSTYCVYVAPHKLLQTLQDLSDVCGDIRVVLARELTKMHEEYFFGTIEEAQLHFQKPIGEFVLLFSLS